MSENMRTFAATKNRKNMKIFQSSIFRAVCAMIVGVLLLKYPQDGVTWLTMAIGALFLLSGVIALIAYWQARRHAGDYIITDQEGRVVSGTQPTFPIVGAGSVILGLVLVITPNAFINGLMYMLAAILILGGITQLMSLISARRYGSVPFGYWVCPSLILVTGLFVTVKPMETAQLPLMILGWCSLLYGVIELVNALKIHSLRKTADRQREEWERQQSAEEHVAEEISSEINSDDTDKSSDGSDTTEGTLVKRW